MREIKHPKYRTIEPVLLKINPQLLGTIWPLTSSDNTIVSYMGKLYFA